MNQTQNVPKIYINCVFACLRLYSDKKRPKPTPKPKLIHKPTPRPKLKPYPKHKPNTLS